MTSTKELFVAHLDEEIEQNPQWAGAILDEIFVIVKEKASTQIGASLTKLKPMIPTRENKLLSISCTET